MSPIVLTVYVYVIELGVVCRSRLWSYHSWHGIHNVRCACVCMFKGVRSTLVKSQTYKFIYCYIK